MEPFKRFPKPVARSKWADSYHAGRSIRFNGPRRFDTHGWQIGFAVREVQSYRWSHARDAGRLGPPIIARENRENISKMKWQCEGSNHVTLTTDRSSLGTRADKLQFLTTKTLYWPAYCSKPNFFHYFFLFFADSFFPFNLFFLF